MEKKINLALLARQSLDFGQFCEYAKEAENNHSAQFTKSAKDDVCLWVIAKKCLDFGEFCERANKGGY